MESYLKGSRIIVPEAMTDEILRTLHTSHMGIEKTKLLARTCVYWKNIDKDITDLVERCDICLESSRKEQKESLLPHDTPSSPWTKLGTDPFDLGRQTCKMPYIRRLHSETSKTVIGVLKTIFSEHGIPEI